MGVVWGGGGGGGGGQGGLEEDRRQRRIRTRMSRHIREEGGKGRRGEKVDKPQEQGMLSLLGWIALLGGEWGHSGTHAVLNKNSLKSLPGLGWRTLFCPFRQSIL